MSDDSEPLRREDDKIHYGDRLFRVEEGLQKLYAKVTNGLTDRSIETRDMVEQLHERQSLFEKEFLQHLHNEEVERHEMTNVIDNVGQSITQLALAQEQTAKSQADMVKAKNKMLYLIIGLLASGMAWVIINADYISLFLDHFKLVH